MSITVKGSSQNRPSKKVFYKIGEVSQIADVPAYVLRFWESEFKFLRPVKGPGRRRTYVDRDIQTVLAIKRMLYDEGYTIEGVRRQWDKQVRKREATRNHPRRVLESMKAALEDVLNILSSDDRKLPAKK